MRAEEIAVDCFDVDCFAAAIVVAAFAAPLSRALARARTRDDSTSLAEARMPALSRCGLKRDITRIRESTKNCVEGH